MPILRVIKNKKHICSVGSDDVWMFSSSVWGDIWGPEVSFLDISGGSKRRDDGESDFLIWEMPCELAKSDRVEFYFEEGSASSPKGKVFDPADYPTEEPRFKMSSPPTNEELTKFESKPTLNSALVWSFSINGASAIELAPDPIRQHVRLAFLWTEYHPQRLRVNLSKNSLREIVNRTVGEEIVSEYVPLGSCFELAVG